ncbi:hypothetical protein C0995_002885, partial [Termitomyces sp. Mi166
PLGMARSFTELESLETQSTTILITALAILISIVIQAHMDNGITNYHASIALSLSWMNNTNLFIYFLLYAFPRARLTLQQRDDEGRSLDDLALHWAAKKENKDAMRSLLEHKIDVQAKGKLHDV